MAHQVEIGIFFIARTNIDIEESNKWLEHMGVKDFKAENYTKTDAEALIEMAGRRCYMSFEPGMNPNVTKIRTNLAEYIENILKSGHGSVLEHASYTFAIEGISRIFTGEMNRHRAGWATSEGSMRYIRLEDMGFWMPPSLKRSPFHCPSCEPEWWTKDENIKENKLNAKKIKSHGIFLKAFESAEKYYNELQEIWKDELAPESKFHAKKEITSMMRRIVPMGIATGGIWTGNIRAIRHVLTMRTTEAAEEEICYVFSHIMKRIAELEPNLFGDFKQDEHGFWSPLYKKV